MKGFAEEVAEFTVPSGSAAVFWLGGGSVVFKSASGKIVYVDPYLTDYCERALNLKRLVPRPLDISKVKADIIVITHGHQDHLDADAIPELARACDAVFVAPPSCREEMRGLGIEGDRFVSIARHEARTVNGVPLTATYADHRHPRGPEPDAIGIIADLDGIKAYVVGDSIYTIALLDNKRYAVDLMCVPINGLYGNMNYVDAAFYSEDMSPEVVIPIHYGMFAENTADPQLFMNALEKSHAASKPVVMDYKGRYVYRKGART